METARICTICYREETSMDNHKKICTVCADIMEFGYVSFPAYRLEEKNRACKNKSEENEL